VISGKPKDKVWTYFDAINIPNDSHKGAQCDFCSKEWKRGKPSEMKAHLALKCSMVPYNVKIECLHMIKNDDIPDEEFQPLNNEKDNNDNDKIAKADKALVRLFVCCGIPFSVVDSPFFHDFTKSLYFGYEPPKRTTLSNTYLNAETASISLKIEEELRHSKDLTLGCNF
jgi:hypothetical protein